MVLGVVASKMALPRLSLVGLLRCHQQTPARAAVVVVLHSGAQRACSGVRRCANAQRRWNWLERNHSSRGQGEATFTAAIVAAAYSEVFAAVVVHLACDPVQRKTYPRPCLQ
jgi:hypothetical protein